MQCIWITQPLKLYVISPEIVRKQKVLYTSMKEIWYSRDNPPTNIVAAEIRLKKVKTGISEIEFDLGSKKYHEFLNEDEYKRWFNSANAALAYLRRENQFLDIWITQEKENEDQKISRAQFDQELAGVLNECLYKPLYDQGNPPQSIEDALARREVVMIEQTWLESQIARVKNLGIELGLYPTITCDRSRFALTPLRIVLERMNYELGVIRRYLKSVKYSKSAETNARIAKCYSEMERLKNELGGVGTTIAWLLSKVDGNKEKLNLSKEDLKKLSLMIRYGELNKEIEVLKKTAV